MKVKLKSKHIVIIAIVTWIVILLIGRMKTESIISCTNWSGLENIFIVQLIITKLIPLSIFMAITYYILKSFVIMDDAVHSKKIIFQWTLIVFILLSLNELVKVLFLDTTVVVNDNMMFQTVVQSIKELKTITTGLDVIVSENMQNSFLGLICEGINIFLIISFAFLWYKTEKNMKNLKLVLIILFIIYITLIVVFGLIDVYSIASWQ